MRFLVLILVIVMLTIVPFSAIAQTNADVEMTVTAEGSGAVRNGDLAQAEDEALADAKRNAVEAGVGVYVQAETIGKNYEVVENTILIKSEGYITTWQKIDGSRKVESFEGSQILSIKISAKVKMLNLIKDLMNIDAIYDGIQRPRIMILITEDNMDKPTQGLAVSSNAIMRVLGDKKFDVVDPEVIKGLIANEASRATIERGDAKAASILAMDQGAEILILGNAKANAQDAGYDVAGVKSAAAVLNARIVYSDTGEVIYTAAQAEGKGVSTSNDEQAGMKALDKAGENLILADSERFGLQVLARWAKEIQNGHQLRLTCRGVSYKDFVIIKNAIKEIRGFNGIVHEKYDSKTANIDVKIKLTPEQFRDHLSEIKIGKKTIEIETAIGASTAVTLK